MKLPFQPKLLAYSTSYLDNPLMSVLVPIPTVKLAELRTHRVLHQLDTTSASYYISSNDTNLCVNANSSRAIPAARQLEMTLDSPYVPIWTENKPGMQGNVFPKYKRDELDKIWHNVLHGYGSVVDVKSGNGAKIKHEKVEVAIPGIIDYVKKLKDGEVHKQDVSLLLNPFSWTACVITGDRAAWESFFALRCPEYYVHTSESDPGVGPFHSLTEVKKMLGDNEFTVSNKSMTYPAIQYIAEIIYDLYKYNEPKYLEIGQWHSAFSPEPFVSMSKCALISYDNHGTVDETSTEQDNTALAKHYSRAKKLIADRHLSTAEHQYQVPMISELNSGDFDITTRYASSGRIDYTRGKYVGPVTMWKQLRKMIECKEIGCE